MASTTLKINEKKNTKYEGNLPFVMGADWIKLENPTQKTIMNKEHLLNILMSPLFRDSRVLVVGDDSLYYGILALQKGAETVDLKITSATVENQISKFIEDEDLKINLASYEIDYEDYDFVINISINKIIIDNIDTIYIDITDDIKIIYPSKEVEVEYANNEIELPIFDILILMTEKNLEYSLLRNWEIITDSIDEYEDMTIDVYMNEESKRYFEKKVKKVELTNDNGWLLQNIEIDDDLKLKLNIINSEINKIDKILLQTIKNKYDIEQGVKILNREYQLLYLIYYSYSIRGGINETINDKIRDCLSDIFHGMYEWKINNFSDILKYFQSKIGQLESATTLLNQLAYRFDSEFLLHNYYNNYDLLRVYKKDNREYREASIKIAQRDIFVLESNEVETKIIDENDKTVYYEIISEKKQIVINIIDYISCLNDSDWKRDINIKKYVFYSKPQEIIILGMHRSGTSLTSSIIERLGIDIGTYLLGQNSSNPNGHFEDQEFINVNDMLLSEAGGAWNKPPALVAIDDIISKVELQISKFIKRKQINSVWSWKDPRTVLTYDLFKGYLDNPKLIIVRRNKEEVIKSLIKRDGFTEEKASKIYDEYISRIETIKEQNSYLEIEYNHLLEDLESQIDRIVKYLEISENHYEIEDLRRLVKPNTRLKNGNLEAARILTDVNEAIVSGRFNIALDKLNNLISNTKSKSSFNNLEYLKAFCLYQLGKYKEAFFSAKNETIINPENEKAFELIEKINKYLPDIETEYSLPIEFTILIDYNTSEELLDRCLKSIKINTTGYHYELIILINQDDINDNNLHDKHDLEFSNFKINQNNGNLSESYNKIFDEKKGEHLFIIDSNIEVTKFWVQPLIEEIKNDIGLAGSMILYKNSSIIHHLSSNIGTKTGDENIIYDLHKYHNYEELNITTKNVNVLMSEVLLLNGFVIESGYKFDEKILTKLNKVDYCLQLNKNNIKVKSVIESKIFIEHNEEMNDEINSADLDYIQQKWYDNIKSSESSVDTTLNLHRIEIQKDQNLAKLEMVNRNRSSDIKDELTNPTNKIDFSIIIPVHNNIEYTKSCIENIYKTSALYAIEVIIINNASDDETSNYLHSLGDQVIVINNITNKSFSEANNQGAEVANGKYLIFLNNDVDVKPGWLESFESAYKSDSNIGIQGGKLLYPSGVVQHAGIVWGPVAENLNLHFHVYLTSAAESPQVNISREYQMLTGAMLCIKSELFYKLNGFDTKYHFGHEDLDLCMSVKEMGCKVWYNHNAVGIHHESITKKSEGIEKFERFISQPDSYDAKNHKYFLSKWSNKLIVDSFSYYLKDKMYGLLGDLDKYDLFEREIKEIFDLLKHIPEENYQEKATGVSEILFFRGGVDFVKNPGLLLNIQYDLLIKAKEYLAGGSSISKQQKILITMFGWSESGGGTILPRNMAKDLVRRGYDVYVFYAGLEHDRIKSPYYLDKSEEEGVKLFGVYNRDIPFVNLYKPEKEINDPLVVQYFEQLLDDIRPDFIHFQNFVGLSFEIAKTAFVRGIYSTYIPYNYHLIDPSLYMIENNLEKWGNVDKYKHSELLKANPELINAYKDRDKEALNLLNKWVNNVQAVSTRVKDILTEFGADANKITVINQISKFTENLSRDDNNIKHEPIRFGFIGGIMPHKGVHNILAASSALQENSCEIYLYGFINDNYKNILDEINTKINVTYKGEYNKEDMSDIRDNIDVAILPSIWEDCGPHVISECLAMGLPIIAPNLGGFYDYIENGINGFIYDYKNINSLAEIMSKIIADDNLLNDLKNNSYLPYNYQEYLDIVSKYYDEKPSLESINNYRLIFKESLNNNTKPTEPLDTQPAMNRNSLGENVSGGFSNNIATGKLPTTLPSPLKLNLGCGNDVRKGFLNLDLYSENPSVIKMDVRKLEFANDSADMILASDVLEHFSHREVPDLLTEWARVLKPNGVIIIRCPNLRLQVDAYVRGDWNAEIASYMIFGGQTNPGDYHAIGFDEKSIEKYLKNAGLNIETIENEDLPQDKGYINLNMNVKARKIISNTQKDEYENIKKRFEENKKEFEKDSQNQTTKEIDPGEIELNIVWEGSQLITHSLALINREICYNIIKSENSNLSIIPYEDNTLDPNSSAKLSLLNSYDVRNKEQFDESLADLPYVWIRHQWPPKEEPPIGAKWILMQPWEFTSHVEDFVEIYKEVDEIWTPSNYSRKSFINSGIDANKVQIIPNGIDPELFTPEGNKYNLKTTKKIKFLFIGGSIMRKGIDILLNVYLSLFKPTDDVCLVIKDIGSNSFYEGQNMSDKINELKNNINYPEIEYINDDLSEHDMASLYRACDVFVSPYRGEGFCLPALEAMACGLPVVVTEGGATDDFVDETCGWLIPADYQAIGDTVNGRKTVGEVGWLNPNQEILGFVLQEIIINPSKLFSLGLNASYRARKYWTWRNSTLKVFSRLDYHYNTTLSQKALNNLPEYSDEWLELAEAEFLYNEGYFDNSVEQFELLIDSKLPDIIKIYAINVIILNCIENQSITKAEKYIEKAKLIDSKNVDLIYLTSKLMVLKDELDEALEIINPLVENWIENKWHSLLALTLDELISYMGDIIFDMGDINSAIEIYEQALHHNPSNLNAIFGAALCFKQNNETERAVEMLESILEIDENYEPAIVQLEEINQEA